jgi:hypothetical protein
MQAGTLSAKKSIRLSIPLGLCLDLKVDCTDFTAASCGELNPKEIKKND